MTQFLINSSLVCPEIGKEYPRITHGKGVYLYDESGKEYIDASSGKFAVSIGYGNSDIGEIMKEQVSKATIIPSHYFSSPEVEEYMELLVNYAPIGFKKAWTASSGSEAIESALKLAIQYHQLKGENSRYKIISRWGSYHGNSIFTLDVGGMKMRRNSFTPLMNNFPHVSPAYAYRSSFIGNVKEECLNYASELENVILKEGPNTIAAFIAEPIVGAALGGVSAIDGYFKEIRRVCDQYGILLVVDEVMSGFARTGYNFAINHYGVIPDIIAASKGITGGYCSFSAIIAHSKVINVFEDLKKPFMGGHTHSCSPFGSAVATYVLKYILRNQLAERSKALGQIFKEKLSRLKKYSIVGDIRGLGLLVGLEFVMNSLTKEPFPNSLEVSKRIGEVALSKGVILYPGKGTVDGQLGDHILMGPPLIVEEYQLERIVQVLEESIVAVTAELEADIQVNYQLNN